VYQAAVVTGPVASFEFTLTFNGPAVTSPNPAATAGTSFGLGVVDENFNPFPAFGSNDPVLRIDISAGNPVPKVSTVITPPIRLAAVVPEPSSLTLAAAGMAIVGMALWSRSHRKTAAAVSR
jgi:PEP-CTERM motif